MTVFVSECISPPHVPQALSVKEGSSMRAELDDLKASLTRVKRQYDDAEEVRSSRGADLLAPKWHRST